MVYCPLTNSEAFKRVASATSEAHAYILWQREKGDVTDEVADAFINDYINSPEVAYELKAVNILQSSNAVSVFAKGEKNNWSLDKILTELNIPKDQKQLILDKNITDREEIITSLLADNTYTIEINTAKQKKGEYDETDLDNFDPDYRQQNTSTGNEDAQYYSNLTVPGGTNYTENEIATPAITPSIKGHAQFSTDNGIGWFRGDDKISEQKKEFSDLLNKNKIEDAEKLNELRKTKDLPTKTRRILEVQSDWGQKQRKSAEPDINIKYDIQQIINGLQKSGDLKIDCN